MRANADRDLSTKQHQETYQKVTALQQDISRLTVRIAEIEK